MVIIYNLYKRFDFNPLRKLKFQSVQNSLSKPLPTTQIIHTSYICYEQCLNLNILNTFSNNYDNNHNYIIFMEVWNNKKKLTNITVLLLL